MGMDLVWLPESLVKGLQAVNGSALAPLTPSDVCEFLRNHPLPADVDHGVVDELLKFVVGEGSTSDPNFECLRNVPLLRLASKEIVPFGSKRCFVDWQDLLPTRPDLFIDKPQFQILLNSHPGSREAVLGAAATLGVRRFKPQDLLEHQADIDSVDAMAHGGWRNAFWQLLWQR